MRHSKLFKKRAKRGSKRLHKPTAENKMLVPILCTSKTHVIALLLEWLKESPSNHEYIAETQEPDSLVHV